MKPPRLAIVTPCYNEEPMLPQSLNVLVGVLRTLIDKGLVSGNSYVLCVDDGSADKTWDIISTEHFKDPHVKGISLAHNRGQQSALRAGLDYVADRCDAVVTIDCDLQDDPNAIVKMLEAYADGAEIVFGVRSSRDEDTWFKRTSAHGFYRFQKLMGVKVVYDHAEYRLMSSRAVHLLADYHESNLYLRGIVAQLGLKTAVVKYPRIARAAGESKYPLSKLLSLSIDGITSFTAKPMRMIFEVGLVLLLIDILVAIWALAAYFGGRAITGWTSIILSVWFLGSLILVALGIIGEYIGKIYIEVKHRPRYAIRDELFD